MTNRLFSQITPVNPVYSGKIYIEGRLSHPNPACAAASAFAGPGNMISMGERKQIAVQQVADGSYRVYLGLVVPEDFHRTTVDLTAAADGTESARSLFLSSSEFYASWPSKLRTFIEHAEGPFRPWPLYNLPVEAVGWERDAVPRAVTLLGDAAHLSTPFAGEGVNCSMHDAVVLFDRIFEHCGTIKGGSFADSSDEALERALAEYEKDMFVRGRDLIRRSKANEIRMFSDDGAIKFVSYITEAMQNLVDKGN